MGSCQVIELIGELDIATAPILKAAIEEMSSIPDQIKVDVSQLDFIDSTCGCCCGSQSWLTVGSG